MVGLKPVARSWVGRDLVLEVYGGVGQVGGDGDGGLAEEVALPGLGGGVVYLEDVEVWVGVAVGEGVEAGTEEDVLGDSVGDGLGEQVFGVAAAGYEEGAEGYGEGLVELGGGAVDFGQVFGAEDGDGDGVVEDEWGSRRAGGQLGAGLRGGRCGRGGLLPWIRGLDQVRLDQVSWVRRFGLPRRTLELAVRRCYRLLARSCRSSR